MAVAGSVALPCGVGVGLKGQHVDDVLAGGHGLAFLEVHAENYMGEGGPMLRQLAAVAARFPLSLHGVALSIGGEAPLDREHLRRLRRLCDAFAPAQFSEHLAWSTHEGVYLNDLLPVPYDAASLDRVAGHVAQVQDVLGRRMLLENPSTYVLLEASTMHEIDFLAAVVARTGCGLLLDVTNVMVSATNHGVDPDAYLDAFPIEHVGEVHLAGYAPDRDAAGDPLLIDAHDRPVEPAVWQLYRRLVRQSGPLPTLIEWDNDVPAFAVLTAEAQRAAAIMAAPLPAAVAA